jgi:hypothetical protein
MKQATRYKSKPKKVESYLRKIVFECEPSFEEREGYIRRCIYREQELNKNKNLTWIIAKKTMKQAVIKFTRKQVRTKKVNE